MLTLLTKSKRTHARYTTTHTKTTAHKLRQATRRLALSFSALAIACMPLLSLPANAQSSITGLSTTSGPSVGGTEVTLEGEVKASFKQVSAGEFHSLGLTNDGAVYAWGYNGSGQLGDGTTTNRTTPTLVTALSGQTVTALAAGNSHSLALTSTGAVYAWGDNSSGQLGDGTTTNRATPTLVTTLSGQTVTAVAGGDYHSLALTSTGAVYAWGANWAGQLGDDTTTSRATPTLVTALSGQTVTAVAGGGSHSLALTSTGAVYAWGDNYNGQLGDGTAGYKTTPATIASETVAVPVPTVTFGGLPATNVQIVDGLSGKELKATTPAHAPGVVDVVITFPGETPITLANAYTYLPTTTVELSGITHPDPNGIAPALASGSLLAAGVCNNITEPSVALLSPTGVSAPASVSLYGGVGFSLSCTSSGETATVSVALNNDSSDATASLPAITSSNLANLRAYKSQGGTLTDITDQATFALGAGNTVLVSYQLVDGGELDEDGVANGIIVDPVYIGYYLGDDTSGSGSLAETGSSTLLMATAGIMLVLGGAGGVYVATTRRRTQFSR